MRTQTSPRLADATLTIAAVRLRRVSVDWAAPLTTAIATWRSRQATLLELVTTDGLSGWGEASPLPGYSTDTIAQADLFLEALRRDLPWRVTSTDLTGQRTWPPGPPSASFALDTALLDLWGQHFGCPLWRLLSGSSQKERRGIALAKFLGPVDSSLELRLDDALARGYGTFKVKLGGPRQLDHELPILRRVAKSVRPVGCLRLDANATLDLGAVATLAALGPEFIEEPTMWQQLPEVARLDVPLALDESLHVADASSRIDDIARLSQRVTVVLKPGAIGGLVRALDLARHAHRQGASVVVSHLLDGPIARRASVHLAFAVPRCQAAAGLDLDASFDAWCKTPDIESDLRRAWSGTSILPPTSAGLGVSGQFVYPS